MFEIIPVIIFGWLLGVVVNYLADVLPLKRKFVKPICVHCFADQPLFNYFFWPRRCRECTYRRGLRTWLVEAVFIALALWLWRTPSDRLGFVVGLGLLVYLSLVAVIDIEYKLILHPVSIFGALLGFAVGIWLHGFWTTILGGAAGFGMMLALYYLGILFAQLISRRRGETLNEVALGFGDVNLAGVLGLILGWPGITAGLILAILFAGAFSVFYVVVLLILRRFRAFIAIPYGPFLIAGAVFLLYFR